MLSHCRWLRMLLISRNISLGRTWAMLRVSLSCFWSGLPEAGCGRTRCEVRVWGFSLAHTTLSNPGLAGACRMAAGRPCLVPGQERTTVAQFRLLCVHSGGRASVKQWCKISGFWFKSSPLSLTEIRQQCKASASSDRETIHSGSWATQSHQAFDWESTHKWEGPLKGLFKGTFVWHCLKLPCWAERKILLILLPLFLGETRPEFHTKCAVLSSSLSKMGMVLVTLGYFRSF